MNILYRQADTNDTEDIYNLLDPYADRDIILRLTKEKINKKINSFILAELENEIIGVVSYYDYGRELKEIRSLAVKDDKFRKGIGRSLVERMTDKLLKEFPEVRIFALSYYPDFFKRLNFQEVDKDDLPEKIWKDCRHCSNRDNCGETALILS